MEKTLYYQIFGNEHVHFVGEMVDCDVQTK